MTIRPFILQDTEAVVELLRLSLGEVSSPKTRAYWMWKHVDNPFGASPVLVAEEDGKLVGVRAFMRWQWQTGQERYSALRAVDTATHPGYRGRGIFKKLTLQLVEECRATGNDFIFNTPNQQSRPGYLKMGWESLGKIPVRIQLRKPLNLLKKTPEKQLERIRRLTPQMVEYFPVDWALAQFRSGAWGEDLEGAGKLYTQKSPAFIDWRYVQCPVQQYHALSGKNFLIVFYLKPQPRGTELRLTEVLLDKNHDRQELKREWLRLIQLLKPDFISAAPAWSSTWLNRQWFLPGVKVGPILTFRPLNGQLTQWFDVQKWAYSLGDLELF